jgi:hypothetical protein
MDLRPTAVFLHNPKQSSIVAGVGTDEFVIDGVLPFISTQVTSCDIACATACLPQQWTIVFEDVDFGDCNDCGKQVSFLIRLRRQANFDIEDYLHLTSSLQYTYEPEVLPATQPVTAADLAQYFLDEFNGNALYDDEHDNFGITAELATTTVADDTLVLNVPCPVQVDVFRAHASEPITVTETDAGATASLTRDQLLKEYPLMIGYVPGQAPDDTFTYCEDICLIELKGCITACISDDTQNLLTTYNAVHLHAVGTKFHYKLFVNSSAPGYAAFIEELNLRVASCSVDVTFGSQVAAVQDPAGATLDLTAIGADGGTATGEFTGFTAAEGTISDGEVTVYFSVTGAPVTADAINTAINTAIGISNTQANGVITLVGVPFNGDATIIKVELS